MITSVSSLEDHEERMRDVEGYRPAHCGCCGRARPHGHGRRVRGLRGFGGLDIVPVEVRRYRCPRCRAIWLVLPKLLARHLWRAWSTVTRALKSARDRSVPERTRRRWRARLRSGVRVLRSVLATSGDADLAALVGAVGLSVSRGELVEHLGGLGRLAELTALVHSLQPGVRVM